MFNELKEQELDLGINQKKEIKEIIFDNVSLKDKNNEIIRDTINSIKVLEQKIKELNNVIEQKRNELMEYLEQSNYDKIVFLDIEHKHKCILQKIVSKKKILNRELSKDLVYDIKDIVSHKLTINELK